MCGVQIATMCGSLAEGWNTKPRLSGISLSLLCLNVRKTGVGG